MCRLLEITPGGFRTDAVRTSSTRGPAGNLDGFSIVLGHEVAETATDPGAEDLDTQSR